MWLERQQPQCILVLVGFRISLDLMRVFAGKEPNNVFGLRHRDASTTGGVHLWPGRAWIY